MAKKFAIANQKGGVQEKIFMSSVNNKRYIRLPT